MQERFNQPFAIFSEPSCKNVFCFLWTEGEKHKMRLCLPICAKASRFSSLLIPCEPRTRMQGDDDAQGDEEDARKTPKKTGKQSYPVQAIAVCAIVTVFFVV